MDHVIMVGWVDVVKCANNYYNIVKDVYTLVGSI